MLMKTWSISPPFKDTTTQHETWYLRKKHYISTTLHENIRMSPDSEMHFWMNLEILND